MSELAEWLRRQIAEDKRLAREAAAVSPQVVNVSCEFKELPELWVQFDPQRVLAECDAKELLIALAEVTEGRSLHADAWAIGKGILATLSVPYADRPGYRSEWAP